MNVPLKANRSTAQSASTCRRRDAVEYCRQAQKSQDWASLQLKAKTLAPQTIPEPNSATEKDFGIDSENLGGVFRECCQNKGDNCQSGKCSPPSRSPINIKEDFPFRHRRTRPITQDNQSEYLRGQSQAALLHDIVSYFYILVYEVHKEEVS
ncbi:hypothetical protein AVEN_47143-1 [Araneus ventricosus]|uniref:Uncharacterized protein n=1 Tax=Araneus ventricosus TaxID=182803 RepID=A0A4Y2SF29_ARAVE|nr:hypothetical protein AVEN_47143-1 [Araneus ventricosus]